MKTFTLLAISGIAIAVPLHHKRDIVYENVVVEVTETSWTTTTVWVDPTDASAAPSSAPPIGGFYEQQPSLYTTAASTASRPEPASAAPAYVPPAASKPSAAAPAPPVAPIAPIASAAAARPSPEAIQQPASSSAPYVAPAAPTIVAPAPAPVASTPSIPAPAPIYSAPAAPAPSPSSPSSGGSSSSGSGDHVGDITYYDVSVGTGSCGTTASNSDPVVALSHLDMNNGANPNANPLCGKMINISYNGNTARARVFDTCPSCDKGSLDLTEALFYKVAPGGDGRVHGVSWSFA